MYKSGQRDSLRWLKFEPWAFLDWCGALGLLIRLSGLHFVLAVIIWKSEALFAGDCQVLLAGDCLLFAYSNC